MSTLSPPYTWRSFGGPLMLVTAHSGAKVVLAADCKGNILVRDESGVLVPITADHPVAQFIETACNQYEQLQDAAQTKALEWIEPSILSNGCWTTKTILGTYSVGFEDGWYAVLEDGVKWEWETPEDPRCYGGPHAAQQACQEHFDRTILSALIPVKGKK